MNSLKPHISAVLLALLLFFLISFGLTRQLVYCTRYCPYNKPYTRQLKYSFSVRIITNYGSTFGLRLLTTCLDPAMLQLLKKKNETTADRYIRRRVPSKTHAEKKDKEPDYEMELKGVGYKMNVLLFFRPLSKRDNRAFSINVSCFFRVLGHWLLRLGWCSGRSSSRRRARDGQTAREIGCFSLGFGFLESFVQFVAGT